MPLSARSRGHRRPPTGGTSQNCQPTTGATLSTMNRDRTPFGGVRCVRNAYIDAEGPPAPKSERASDLH